MDSRQYPYTSLPLNRHSLSYQYNALQNKYYPD